MGEGLRRAREAARATRADAPDVRPGQVWADNDLRAVGRTLRVERVEDGKAICVILTNRDATDPDSPWQQDARGRTTRISLSRFRPTSTGYRLVRDSQYGIRWPTGSVFAFPSRKATEDALCEDGRGIGVLVVYEYEPGTDRSTEWKEVAATQAGED